METTTCQDCHISSLIGLTENKIKMNQKKQMNLSVLQTFNYYHRCLLLFYYPITLLNTSNSFSTVNVSARLGFIFKVFS